jgi:clan AA aspartic protease
MGLVYADITLSNPSRPDLASMTVSALVDSGALHLCVPEHVAEQLALQEEDVKEVWLADGQKQRRRYVAPVRSRFENRVAVTGAMVLGDEVLLGAIPMEDMDVMIHPATRKLIVNPENPNFACTRAKGVRAGSCRS